MQCTSAHAAPELGDMYTDRQGGPKDVAHAQELFEEACARGNADATLNLGHGRGKGIKNRCPRVLRVIAKPLCFPLSTPFPSPASDLEYDIKNVKNVKPSFKSASMT